MKDNLARKMNLVPLNTEPMHKDGDGGGEDADKVLAGIITQPAQNGWILTTMYVYKESGEEEEIVEVFSNYNDLSGNRDMVYAFLQSVGLENDIKIK